ncbi:MAG: hypothetical protein A2W71_02480 [Candidatus Nealsonbacteria bacterium RIFCSPLOWO2_02_39_8]|uniref:Restriction endonuclease n=1 Tax=Candidatus Nealsonbacteria bacterium RIFCSPLOWO2_02_39_8 TaxID=1801674 RepID=A0A1G2EG97_9BACT|nr:MAG: hypothetical protein UT22_C0016G0003 [Parcubacteria group bacterium GW2011_GWC2_39_11]OGZ24804.1 MAG: hypothetical protein A2W71_02480 [Candidatus Nealsonbacteria bacterium RIFCSPLOWO2_02_39_8]
MVISKIFEKKYKTAIERKIKNLLNNSFDMSKIEWTWAIGDFLMNNLYKIIGDLAGEYSSSFARRAMADLAFTDKDGFYYVVDVKTHRLDTKFNMPNLTSVERLSRFYEEDVNYFSILKIDYQIEGAKAVIENVIFVPIEFFNWDCLTIGALGWGQIQIANANVVNLVPKNSRKKWMLELCDTLLEFYPKEIGKIGERIVRFKEIRKFWEKEKY